METTIYYAIIAILVFDYLLERLLDYLNLLHRNNSLPPELQDVYDHEKYVKQQAYEKTTSRFGFITSTFSFILILLMFALGGFAFIDSISRSISTNPILIALIFSGILMFASDIITTPFEIYGTFVIEQQFGFNKTTPKTFILDKLKGWMLSVILGGGLMSLVIWFYTLSGEWFWIYAWIALSLFSIFMAMFYSSLIVPLFNKQTPLESGELRTEIESFSSKVGFKLDNIFQIDGSKRSTKANAYFSGLGAKKRIVLYDTLIKEMNINEIVSVLAHEIGHYKKKHTLKSMIISILHSGFLLFVFSLFIAEPELLIALGKNTTEADAIIATQSGFHLAMLTFGILYTPFSLVLGLIMNIFSRKNEYEADAFATKHQGAKSMVSALKKLSRNNLSNITPHPAYVFFYYSHPTLLQRIRALQAQEN